MRAYVVVLVVLGIQACDSGSDSEDRHPSRDDDTGSVTDTSGDSGDSAEEEPVFMPEEGAWTFVDGAILSDSCQYDYDTLPSGGDGFTLTRTEDMAFLLLLDGSEDALTCAWDELQDFGCELVENGEPIDDLDATITSSLGLSGSFTEENAMSSTYDIGIDCVGDDCYLAEWASGIEFPCQVVVELVASAGAEDSE